MPFCSQCGNQVGAADAYCGRCGARQPPAAGYRPEWEQRPSALESVNGRMWSILCYVPWVGWIAAVVVLASNRFRQERNLRFHAFQGLYLFVGWLIADQVLRPLFWGVPQLHIYQLIEAVLLAMSIFMMVKAAHNEAYPLPLFGELAERSVSGG
jgi:uncharacterized membrane protein